MIYSLESLAELLETDAASILGMIRDDGFPSPIYVGGRFMRWLESDVFEWLNLHTRFLNNADDFNLAFARMRCELRREYLEKHTAEEDQTRASLCGAHPDD